MVLLAATFHFASREFSAATEQATRYMGLVRNTFSFRAETGRPIGECFKPIHCGFKPREYYLLGLDKKDTSNYVSTQSCLERVNGNARYVLTDKVACRSIFGAVAERFPERYATERIIRSTIAQNRFSTP